MAQQPSKWSHRHNRLAYSPEWKKSQRCTGRTITGHKTLPCCTPDTTLTSLLQQESTITCCDRFDRNCVNIDNTKPPSTHRTELIENSLMVDPINGFAEVNLDDPSLLLTLQYTLQCMRHAQNCITGTQTFPISHLSGWKHTTALIKSSEAN